MTNAAPQNLGPHFARACAVQMHVSTSQGPLYTEMYRKSAAAQLDSERGHALDKLEDDDVEKEGG